MNKHDHESDRKQDPTYGGVHYRWRYDEYKRTLEEKRRRADKRAGLRFGIGIAVIGGICLVILLTALLYSFSKDEGSGETVGDNFVTEGEIPQENE